MATQQKTTIVIEGDHSKATDALDKVNKAVDKVKENVKELGKEFDKLEPAVNSIRNAATGLNQSATQVRQATAEFRNLDGTVRSATNSLGSMSRSATSSTSSLGSAGRSATQMATGMQSAVSATDILTRQLNHLNLAVAGSSSALGAFRNLMGTLGISIGAGQLAQYMDAWVNLAARLKLATNNTTELKVAQEAVVNISKESRMSLVDLADLYYKVGSSAKDMGINQTQVIKHVQAVANAILISGSSAESAKAALVQYSQAFASNRFGGDELRSVAEQAPRLFKAIREGLVDVNGEVGVSTAQMKQLAAEGFITAAKMNEAMMNSSAKLKEEAKSMPITIGQAFTILNNELVRFIGSESQTSGAFTAIVNGILSIANNVETLVRAMVVGTGAWISYKAAIVATTVAEYAGIAAASSRNASITASALARSQTTAAEVANTEAQLANAVAAERIAITQAQRLAASGLMTNAVLANTAAVQANAVAQAEYTAAAAISTGATTRLAIAFDTLTLGMMRNPFVALLVVLGSFATYLYTIRNSLTEVDGKMVSVGAIWQATWEDIGNKIFKAKNYLADLIPDAVVSGWTSSINVLNQLLDKAGSYFGGSTNEPSDITKRAMAIDAKANADAEAKAKKDSQDVEEAKSYTFVDLAAKIASDTKSLPTITNYNKQLEEVYKKRSDIDKAFVETQNQLQAEMLKAKQKGEKEIAQQRATSIDFNIKKLAESKTALDDQEAEIKDKIKTIFSENEGNSKKKREFEAIFRDKMTRDIATMIDEQSQLKGIESAAVKALIAVESGFNQQAEGSVTKSGHRAKTMFQFFEPAAQSVGSSISEMLSSDAKTIEVGTKYFAKMLDDSHGNVIEAVARYHDGTGAITAMIKKNNGKFDLAMVSEEGQKEIQNFRIALAAQNSSVTEIGKAMRENYKEQEAAAKQQENVIKAIAKRGSPEEDVLIKSQQQVNEYAKTLNADAKLVEEANARIAASWKKLADKKLDPFRDYTATAKELYASLQSGDITQSQFNLGIAKSKGTLANRTSETDVPVERQQDVIAFSKIVKDEEKATAAMTKFNDQMDKSTAAFDSFGHSGKMAFDGILGGISAVAGAASAFGADLTKLNAMQTDSQKNYDKAMKQVGATEADKAKATEKYNIDKIAYNEASTAAEISGARQIASATSKLFNEKSTARKVFHGIEMGLAVVEMAMQVKKIALNVTEAITNQGKGDPYSAFARIAAMAAIMAAVAGGVAVSVMGGDKVTDLTTPESQTTGSILGDNEKQSTSIKNITDTLNSIHASEYVELKGLNTNFKNLVTLTTTNLAMTLRDRGAFTYSASDFKNSGTSAMAMVTGYLVAGVVGVLGAMLFGIGSIKYEAVGGGIVSNAQKLMLDGMEKGIKVLDYTKIKKTVTGWFSDSITYFDVITGEDAPMTKLFRQIFGNIGVGIKKASEDVFKDASLLNTDIMLPKMKLALKSGDKYNAENQKKIEDYINKTADAIATQAYGRYLSVFQKMGEGMLETVQRLADQAVIAKAGFEKFGTTITLSGLGLISFSDSLATAFGGLKELQSGLNELYDSFTSDTQKLKDAREAVDKLMTSLKIPAGTGTPTTITTNADVSKVIKYLGDNENTLGSILGELKKTLNIKPEDKDIQTRINKLAGVLGGKSAELLKSVSPANFTTDVLKAALKDTRFSIAGEDNKKTMSAYYQPLITYGSKNADYLASVNAFEALKTNEVLIENLKKFGETLPDTIDGMQTLNTTFNDLQKNTSDSVKGFADNTKALKLLTAANEKAAEAGKYTLDFSKTVSNWIKNLNATQLGSPKSQLDAAQANFTEQINLAQFAVTAEEKRSALSGITGYADTYINAIKNYYASSEEGQKAITNIMNQVKDLDKPKAIEELQLDVLTGIKDAIESGNLIIPAALEAANAKTFVALVAAAKEAAAVAAKSGTAENQIKYDALAKLVLVVDKTATSGADATFLNALVASIGGTTGLETEVSLIINDAQFSLAEKDKIIANILAEFNKQSLNLTNFNFDVLDAVLTAKKLVTDTWGKPALDVSVDEVVRKIGEIDKLSRELNALLTTENGVTVVNEDAKKKILEIDSKTKELNALIEKENLIKVLPKDAIDTIGRISELSGFLNALITKDNTVTVIDDEAKRKINTLRELTSTFMIEVAKVPTMDVNTDGVIGKLDAVTRAANAAMAAINAAAQAKVEADAAAAAIQQAAAARAQLEAENKIAVGKIEAQTQLEIYGKYNDITASSFTPDNKSSIDAIFGQGYYDTYKYRESTGALTVMQEVGKAFTPTETTMPKFAMGGITNEPSIFGEAGFEAAVPLPDGRSIPVKIINPSNDSNINTAETIAELKSQNQKLEVLVNTMMATSKAEREKTQELIDAMNGLRTDTRLKNKA